ncbi:TyeA family type III secretion system gatekeeper subunit [Pseudomonas fontis]|uniref:TyeA family type III secretion system gatekeeper subunit n=1 Tax=Pseudomonas fontis TaxID=2942633 RepID=A0ABT5NZT2_9PSED|nr:TyeA family type III secretion system gatekeeper subunit [Pseudomonas fontis]MDD0976395.1 TyeA family type III secretion system gatekeeper subunit [Pseudomonas fontis]MDD0993719.1 TyeA family type III secretion system gatekeeper subunit [Pseudomonas fontis]
MASAPSDLMGDLITLIDKRWVGAHDLERLADAMGIAEVVQRIHFYREIKRLIRLLPLYVFVDDEQRQHLLDVCQQVLDHAVDEEEERRLEP